MRVFVPWLRAYQCWSCQSVFLVSEQTMAKMQVERSLARLRIAGISRALAESQADAPIAGTTAASPDSTST